MNVSLFFHYRESAPHHLGSNTQSSLHFMLSVMCPRRQTLVAVLQGIVLYYVAFFLWLCYSPLQPTLPRCRRRCRSLLYHLLSLSSLYTPLFEERYLFSSTLLFTVIYLWKTHRGVFIGLFFCFFFYTQCGIFVTKERLNCWCVSTWWNGNVCRLINRFDRSGSCVHTRISCGSFWIIFMVGLRSNSKPVTENLLTIPELVVGFVCHGSLQCIACYLMGSHVRFRKAL